MLGVGWGERGGGEFGLGLEGLYRENGAGVMRSEMRRIECWMLYTSSSRIVWKICAGFMITWMDESSYLSIDCFYILFSCASSAVLTKIYRYRNQKSSLYHSPLSRNVYRLLRMFLSRLIVNHLLNFVEKS